MLWWDAIVSEVHAISLKMELRWASETLASYYNAARLHNPEYLEMNLGRRENLKSCIRFLQMRTTGTKLLFPDPLRRVCR
jgi:hypothetical protein